MSDTLKKVAIAVLILLILASSFVYYNNYVTKSHVDAAGIVLERRDAPAENQTEPENQVIQTADALLKVHVAGAVNLPGLYEAPEGSRVADFIALAGGAAADSDLDRINLAAVVEDGQQIHVPRISSEVADETYIDNTGGINYLSSNKTDSGLININTADISELKSLPGIGDALSTAIINYRDSNGSFRTIEDIKNVSGIGEKRFDQIKDLITVN